MQTAGMTVRRATAWLGAMAALVVLATGLSAQLRGIKAELDPVVDHAAVHAGTTVKAALIVRLPDGYHTQSNKPRDPSLIPTVLTISPPAGVTVDEIVFPPAHDFTQAGQAEPLAVFEREFVVGVQFTLGALPEGQVAVPALLRYQTCDQNVCYAPVKAELQWTLNVVAATAEAAPQKPEAFAAIKWGTGEKPGAAPAPTTPSAGATSAAAAPSACPPATSSRRWRFANWCRRSTRSRPRTCSRRPRG